MALFHDARRGDEACVARHEDGFRIAVAQRLQLAQPSGEHRRDVVERQFRVDVQSALGFALRRGVRQRNRRGGV